MPLRILLPLLDVLLEPPDQPRSRKHERRLNGIGRALLVLVLTGAGVLAWWSICDQLKLVRESQASTNVEVSGIKTELNMIRTALIHRGLEIPALPAATTGEVRTTERLEQAALLAKEGTR